MCFFFFFFLISTEIPTNAMLCHTIPYHILLEITFPPLTALLGDSPLLLSAYSVSAARCHERTRVVTSVLSRTTFNPRIAASASLALGKKEPRIFRISIYVRMGVLVIGPAMYCTVLYRQKEKKESKERHSRHVEEYSYNFAFSLIPPSSSFMRLFAVA